MYYGTQRKICCSYKSLKTSKKSWLKIKKSHSVIKFYQKAWLKPYINMYTELRKHAKKQFEKNFFKLINNSVFRKIMENVRNHRDIKLVTWDKGRKDSLEPNYYSLKKFLWPFNGNRNENDIRKND